MDGKKFSPFNGRYTKFLDEQVGKGARWTKNPLFNVVQPEWGNFGTGLEVRGLASAAISTAMIGIGAGKMAYNSLTDSSKSKLVASKAVDAGSLPGMSYDAVGNVSGSRRDLGATGDIVFGLNNMRRGR